MRPTIHPDRGFSLLEILIAVTIISLSGLPILYMGRYNMDTTRLDRVRLEVESICHNTLERFGRAKDDLAGLLVPSGSDPNLLVGDNVQSNLAFLYGNPGHLGMNFLVTQHKFRMRVELKKEVAAGLDQLTCRVFWRSDRERKSKEESVAYARYILHAHGHP
jgi:prepilin-type N-terminal cleavage/methylation domain-containing protein